MVMMNPEGLQARRVVQGAIVDSGLRLEDVDSVLAHAAGTRADDNTEVSVLRSVFADSINQISVTSVKSMLGHTQGACGAIESAAAILAIANGLVPPTINCDTLDAECRINIVRGKHLVKPIRCLLMNTFGFGGKNVAVIFRAFEGNRWPLEEKS
jgi:3-oxoacyl-[acyl-carrier-protein] synthase II